MTDLISIETVNGIEIKMDPLSQRYEATINGDIVRLKSLSELRKRCRATFEPTTILVVRQAPALGNHPKTAIETNQIRGISEHSKNYGEGKEYRLQVLNGYSGYETNLRGDMYVYDDALKAELDQIEAEGRAYVQSLTDRWRKTLADRGRQLTIENLLQGKPAPSTDGDTP